MNNIGLIDIHTHIMSGMDDGARNTAEELEMLKQEYAGGVRSVILTPHYNERSKFTKNPHEGLTRLKEAASCIGPDFKIYQGNEIYYTENTVKLLESGKALSMADSRYVLVEFYFGAPYQRIFAGIQELVLHGYWPVLAHAERYVSLVDEKGGAQRLRMAGAYIQVNAGSFTERGLRTKIFVESLVKKGHIDFIGSDCHNMTSRPPNMNGCMNKIERKYGEDAVWRLFFENPSKILNNVRLPR